MESTMTTSMNTSMLPAMLPAIESVRQSEMGNLKSKITRFIEEIEKRHRTNRSKKDKEELMTILEMLECGEIDADSVHYDCLQFDSYTTYLEQGQSNKRRIKTKNIKCQYCDNLMIKRENRIYCARCDMEIDHTEKSTSNNNYSHFKRNIENYTGENSTPSYITVLIPDITIWLTDLKYYRAFVNIFVHTRASKIYENEADKAFIASREVGFTSEDIPYIHIFKHVMFYFHKYLITTNPTSPSYSEDIAAMYHEKVGYEFQCKTIEKFPNLFHYGQNYYKLMIKIFDARKLELTTMDKQLILKIFISYRNFQTEYETVYNNKARPNTNLFFVILRNILKLPCFNGKYHYILPYLAQAKKSTEMVIENKWFTFLEFDEEVKKYLTVSENEKS